MIAVLAALAAGAGAQGVEAPSCTNWGPTLNGGLTVIKPCADAGPTAPPLVLTRATVARFTPGRWSGLVVDASTLKLADGPIPEGGELLRVKVRQGYAARLTSKFVGRGMGGAALNPGDLVYGVSMRQSITMGRPGGSQYETAMSGMIYLYCAPVRMKSDAPDVDRGMCFVDAREKNEIGLFPGIKLYMDKQYTLVTSGRGEAAHAPGTLQMDATMGVRKPKVEAFDGPYPDAFDLVVTWAMRDGRRVLEAKALDAAGSSVIARVALDAPRAAVFGGELAVEVSPAGLTPRFERPAVDGAIVGFQADQTARASN
jgi:hypothetical protein